jgi:CBS-domain-containing membrane protein
MDWAHAAAAALALGGTAGLMEWLDVAHPPAGATTVVVALGQLRGPLELACAFAAVVLLVALGGAVAILRGQRYPLWRNGSLRRASL